MATSLSLNKWKILYNPSSGGGNCKNIIKEILKQFKELKFENYEFVESNSLEHFKEVVISYDPSKADYLLVICGGDGSI